MFFFKQSGVANVLQLNNAALLYDYLTIYGLFKIDCERSPSV